MQRPERATVLPDWEQIHSQFMMASFVYASVSQHNDACRYHVELNTCTRTSQFEERVRSFARRT